ncbi:peptide deformylase [Rickettsiales bacterium]|nr:peptide deformylase [Rickettsiales bacterium]
MSLLKILTIPDPRLKHKSLEVKAFNNETNIIVKDMYETLYDSGNGIGLAAPQVGILKRIVVIDLKEENISKQITLINPKILNKSNDTFINEEGCLSVPEYYAEVERSREIEYEWYNQSGKRNKSSADGLLSICIQHEIDHLNGILFIDYLSSLKRKMALEKLNRIKKRNK